MPEEPGERPEVLTVPGRRPGVLTAPGRRLEVPDRR
jgi:hypothetical protein